MRNEYPRMDRKRDDHELLNGIWQFMFDEQNIGIKEEWYNQFPEGSLEINVPFAYQTTLSGINDIRRCDVVWYKRTVEVKAGYSELHFGAVDFEADVFIDGLHKLNHIGGETEFVIDLFYQKATEIEIVVRVYDPSKDEQIPRGKQFWEDESRGIWYTPTTGIWQSVWIDYVGEMKINNVKTTSLLNQGVQNFKVNVSENAIGLKLKLEVKYEEEVIYCATQDILTIDCNFDVEVYNNQIFKIPFHGGGQESICWSPENPRLFDYQISIVNDTIVDSLAGYFGFREIKFENGLTILNNSPYYFKLVLDQGYWKDGLLTAPTDEDYKRDIELAKEMGFNGCRKHQKVEDPRFLYWADKLGFLVWGEVASCPVYSERAVKNSQMQWFDIIERDYNHPCIVAWVPLNESWGVPFINFDEKQQAHSMSLYYQIKSIDNTRLIVNNDGWEMTKTDVCAIHNYNHGAMEDDRMKAYFNQVVLSKENLLNSMAAGKPQYAKGFKHDDNTPIMITEFGGIGYDLINPKGWGYTSVTNAQDLLSEYQRIIDAFSNSTAIFGYCYTQLYDVEQEVNGFLTYDRKPKCDLQEVKKINDSLFVRY